MSGSTALERSTRWPLWGGTAHLVVRGHRAGDLRLARSAVDTVLDAVELAASRFRPDSEISRLAAADGRPVGVSPLLADLVTGALGAAEATGGAVDPTLGLAMIAAGYDAAFGCGAGLTSPAAPADLPVVRRLANWRDVQLAVDPVSGLTTVRTPPGVLLDLGATAKAMAADRAADLAGTVTGCPVLVSLCGDLAVAGTRPDEPWLVQVLERPGDQCGPLVHVYDGGVATSSTATRRWFQAGKGSHHLLDPATGLPVSLWWRTATVAAATCLEANTASTAVIVKGVRGGPWLAATGLPGRLVFADGAVHAVNDWPAESLEKAS